MKRIEMRYPRTIIALVLSLMLSVGIVQIGTMRSAAQISESFEGGFGPWTPDMNYDPAYFSITISSIYAYDGSFSVAMMVHGLPPPTYPQLTGWIERTIQIPPSATRDIGVNFWVYSEAPLDVPRNVTAYIGTNNPEQFPDFMILGQTEPPQGWKQFFHMETVTAGPTGTIYVAVGIHNNKNLGPKTYYIDLVEITGISDDFTPPVITNMLPQNETTIGDNTPTIGANYSDPSGIDTSSVILKVDGTNVTSSSLVLPDGVEYTPPPLPDGFHNVSLQVRDDCVNHNLATASWWFNVDATPPTTTLSIGNPKNAISGTTYFSSATQFTLIPDDGTGIGGGTTWYRIWSEASGWSGLTQYSGPFTISGLDGLRYIEYNSTDGLDNSESPKNHSVISGLYLDNTGPDTTITIGFPQYDSGVDVFVNSNTDFNLTAVDIAGLNGLWYKIDTGTLTKYNGDFNLIGLNDGLHTIYYNGTDSLGNTETPKSDQVKLDNTPPTTTLFIGTPKVLSGGTTYFNSTTSFTLTHNNDGTGSGVASTWYRIWNATAGWSNLINYTLTGSFTITGADGIRYIEYNSTDRLGNKEAPVNHTSFSGLYLDDSGPITILSISDPKYDSGVDMFVSSVTEFNQTSFSLAGIQTIRYKVDAGGSWTQYTGDFTLAGADEGDHTIFYHAVDKLGTQESYKSRIVVVDNTPPISTIPGYDPLTINYINNEFEFFTVTATDGDGSGVDEIHYGIDDSNCPSTYINQFVLGSGIEGPHRIYFKSIDNLGNEEAVKYIIIFLDKTPPTADAGNDKEISTGETTNLDARESDDGSAGSGIANYTWTFEYQGETVTLEGELAQFKFENPGTYEVTLTVYDNAGNMGTDNLRIKVGDDLVFPWWILLVMALIIVIIILFLLLLRKKRKTEEEQEESIEKEEATEEEPEVGETEKE